MKGAVMQSALKQLQRGEMLSSDEAEAAFGAIMQGEATPAQVGALLMGLSIQGESAEVIAGAARAMRAAATRIDPHARPLLDTCGTGGDGACTFNISTCVALVVAAAGQPVAKHGNRAVSSRSGSADVLESLGVGLDLPPERVAACIDEVGIGFLFAQSHHPAMKYAASPRRELGVRTIFNLLGPLTNPADAEFQVVGVYARGRLELVAAALQQLGIRRALVVHGRDGLDEITTTAITDAIWVEQGQPLRPFEIDPAAFGMPYVDPAALTGGDAEANAATIRDVLAGGKTPARDIVLLNAAAALWVAGRVDGIPAGLRVAAETLDGGEAMQLLDRLAAFTQG